MKEGVTFLNLLKTTYMGTICEKLRILSDRGYREPEYIDPIMIFIAIDINGNIVLFDFDLNKLESTDVMCEKQNDSLYNISFRGYSYDYAIKNNQKPCSQEDSCNS